MEDFPVAFPRIQSIADADSFEIFPLRQTSLACTRDRQDFAIKKSCGVLTGFCKIDQREVGVFSQEPTRFAGAMGWTESRLVCELMDASLNRRCPVVGLLHSSGAKIQEGVNSLAGYAEIFKRNVQLSGVVPQISIILGTCAGGAVYSPALTDFILIERSRGEMFITGPEVIRQTTGEVTDRKNLGGAEVHSLKSGLAHWVVNDHSLRTHLQRLLSFLPAHCNENPPRIETEDSLSRNNPDLELLAKQDKRKAYEVKQVIESISDRQTFIEVQADFAKNIVIGFARLGGAAVGFVANNPAHLAGALDADASMKAARFVRFCDCFNIPIITLVDVPGYWPGIEQEHAGIIRHGAKLLHAYAEAEVPRITLILRKAYGGAYCVMGSKQCGATANFAWPNSEIAVMGPAGAVEILFKRELALYKDSEKVKQLKIEEYLKNYANPDLALKENYIDRIIQPSQTRKEILEALEHSLQNYKPHFKHKNIPL